ncbi:MAG: hypothetical protein JWP03_5017 [Phycisphaerales bacterium]|nr:hypothetical protein [Phycisphaerales bacterium]
MLKTHSSASRSFPAHRPAGEFLLVSLHRTVRNGRRRARWAVALIAHVTLLTICAMRSAAAGARQPALAPHADPVQSLESRRLLSVTLDANGWTVVTPQTGSHVIYVSSSGGNDNNTGLSAASPVRTIAKGESLMRDHTGDQLLLKAGDVWHENFIFWRLSGKSAQEPIVIGSYGTGARPILMTGTGSGFATGASSSPEVDYVDLIGLRFWADGRDPAATAKPVASGATGIAFLAKGTGILVENCLVQDYAVNMNFQDMLGPIQNVSVRRNVVIDSYSTTGHSQGMYATGVSNLLIEGNLFDHNGYNEKVAGAEATWYNHDIYLSSHNTGVVVRDNTISRAAGYGLQDRPGGIVQNNLFINDPVGMTFGLVNGASTTPGGVSGQVTGNVFIGGANIGTLQGGSGLIVGNVKAGGGTVIANNIFTHSVANSPAAITLSYGSNQTDPQDSVGINDISFKNNIVYNWTTGVEVDSGQKPGGTGLTAFNRVSFTGNEFENLSGPALKHRDPIYTSQEKWSGDVYFATGGWTSGGKAVPMDTATLTKAIPFIDPSRTIESYNQSVGGAASVSDFIAKSRLQSKQTWNTKYDAAGAVGYITKGFQLSGTIPPVVGATPKSARSVSQALQWSAESGVAFDNFSGLGYADGGDWAEYKQLDFGTGITKFSANVATLLGYGGTIELHLDGVAGKLIGTLKVSPTGVWSKYTLQSTAVTGATGVHDLYLVFKGGKGVANVQNFSFA